MSPPLIGVETLRTEVRVTDRLVPPSQNLIGRGARVPEGERQLLTAFWPGMGDRGHDECSAIVSRGFLK